MLTRFPAAATHQHLLHVIVHQILSGFNAIADDTLSALKPHRVSDEGDQQNWPS